MTERYTLIEGDCISVMRSFAPNTFDAIIADLPYGTTACAWDSIIPLAPMWEQFKRVIKPSGAIVLFGSQPFTSELITSNLKWFKYCWVWEKSCPTCVLNAHHQPLRTIEDIVIFCKGVTTYNPQGLIPSGKKMAQGRPSQNYGRRSSETYTLEFTNWPRQKLSFANARGVLHPTQKPVALLAYLIQTYTNPSDIVLDCTMGSGTTIVAAIETGRKAVGIELDPGYFQIATQRCADAARAAQGLPKELRGKATDIDDMPLFAEVVDIGD